MRSDSNPGLIEVSCYRNTSAQAVSLQLFWCVWTSYSRGAQPLACKPHMAHGTKASSPQGSLGVRKFGNREAVLKSQALHSQIVAKLHLLPPPQPPSCLPVQLDWFWAMPPTPHVAGSGIDHALSVGLGWGGLCPFHSMCLDRGRAAPCPLLCSWIRLCCAHPTC